MKKLVLTVMSLCLAVTMWGQTPAGSEWSPQVKQAATMIKENPAKASEAFDELMKGKNKKNTSLLVEIGLRTITVSVRNWPMYIIRWGSMAKQKKLMKVI